MSLRDRIRDLRFFYKPVALQLYRDTLANYRQAWRFPFVGSGEFDLRGGGRISVPRRQWMMLPAVCRLQSIGANVLWRDGDMEIALSGYRFRAPPARFVPTAVKGLLLDDVWRAGQASMQGSVVVDIGGYIGLFALLCASRGAKVHCFEPFPIFRRYIDANAKLNGVAERIVVHEVGLSHSDETVTDSQVLKVMASAGHGCGGTDGVRLADALGYLRQHGIANVELLKMNCEGCEYALFSDDRVLKQLNPKRVSMEFHSGLRNIPDLLKSNGYDVEISASAGATRGLIFANRRAT